MGAVRVDKRKWETRPVQVWRDVEGNHGLGIEHAFVYQSIRLVDERNGEVFEVSSQGSTDREAVSRLVFEVRAARRSGRFTRYPEYCFGD